jgi:hypothetical protein
LFESVAVPTKLSTEPEFVGVVVEDSVLSSASTVQTGGVFSTVTEVVTSSALTVETFTSKKANDPMKTAIVAPTTVKSSSPESTARKCQAYARLGAGHLD